MTDINVIKAAIIKNTGLKTISPNKEEITSKLLFIKQ